MRELPRGTITFLFTDIEGSTRLLRKLGDRYTDVLAEHRRVLRQAFAAHDGVEVDTQGDAFFVAFERASDAVAAADEAQRVLAQGPVEVRMGIHSGEPAVTDEGAGEALGAKGELQREIADKRLLLLLDNFEHVIDAAGEVAALLGASLNLTVLVTSRERLQLAGEHEYAVPAMASSDGLELFFARARALGMEVDGDEAARELRERLDNLPLALELAAARTKLFSPAQLLERLGKRLDLFKGGRDADPRQRTLRATIEWSYDLLTPEEQQLFARLSVFAGGCTYEAAEVICDADEDTLQSLLDKSLARRREGRSGDSHYWMLETIRQFAGERLEEDPRARELRDAHLRYFVEHTERKFEQARAGGSASEFYRRLQLDEGNVRAGLAWALERGETEALLRLTAATW